MNATGEAPTLQQEIAARLRAFPALRRSFRAGARARASVLAEVTKEPEPPRPRDPARELAGLEDQTVGFRRAIARAHVARVRDVGRAVALALEEWTDVAAGAAEALPCKNGRWRPGFGRPPANVRRCRSTHVINGERVRCSLLRDHVGAHQEPHVRAKARALLRECPRTCLGRKTVDDGAGGLREVFARVPCLQLHGHRGKCKPRRPKKWDDACPCALCTLHEGATSREWHEAREGGQIARFDRVRGCGKRMRTATCNLCGTDRRAVPEGCGVRRVCPKCDVMGAVRRRARFGRARGRAFVHGHRYGLMRRVRRGGRFSEKMLTLTIPHALLEDSWGLVRRESRDTLHARVLAVFKAWPLFLRMFNDHLREALPGSAKHVEYHRAFEWTPGRSDEHGHPHFHVYFWCPWVDRLLIRGWWAEALRSVGWPVADDREGNPVLSVRWQMLRSVDVKAVRELMKGGKRSALTLSRIEFHDPREGEEFRRKWGGPVGPGVDAFKYAEGWTLADISECSDDVRARLYMALEGRRLTQASRGFFEEDPRAACECCGASMFRVHFAAAAPEVDLERLAIEHEPTGPPKWHDGLVCSAIAKGGLH